MKTLCKNDTDGDGDCHLCLVSGACFGSNLTIAERVRRVVNRSPAGPLTATQIARLIKAEPASVSSFLHRERKANRVVFGKRQSKCRRDQTAWVYFAFPLSQ
jgi:hypothetical protein